MTATVLIVEDELVIAHYLRTILEQEGYRVTGIAREYDKAVELAGALCPDIVLMDILLKGERDGIETAHAIQAGCRCKIIYLTAHGDRDHLDRAKHTHPQGFLVKPVNDLTLIAMVEVALGSSAMPPESSAAGEGIRIYPDRCSIRVRDREIPLTEQELSFVKLLMKQPGSVVPYERIERSLNEEGGISDGALKTLIWRLRKKLPADTIQTRSGIGYFIAAALQG